MKPIESMHSCRLMGTKRTHEKALRTQALDGNEHERSENSTSVKRYDKKTIILLCLLADTMCACGNIFPLP